MSFFFFHLFSFSFSLFRARITIKPKKKHLTLGLEDLGAGREPDGGLVRERHAVVLEDLRDDAAERAEHGPAGVDDLDGAVAGEGLRVGREAGGVPAVVAGELAGEVSRRAREGAEVEVAVFCFKKRKNKVRKNCSLASKT